MVYQNFDAFVFARSRTAFPKAQIRVRFNGAFSTPVILDILIRSASNIWLAAQEIPTFNLRSNSSCEVLVSFPPFPAKPKLSLQTFVIRPRHRSPPRLVVNAEVFRFPRREALDDDRYVVTNLTINPERVYQIYRSRGDMGNNIKESLALNSECPFAFIIGNKFRYYEKGLGVFVYSNTPGIIPLFG